MVDINKLAPGQTLFHKELDGKITSSKVVRSERNSIGTHSIVLENRMKYACSHVGLCALLYYSYETAAR